MKANFAAVFFLLTAIAVKAQFNNTATTWGTPQGGTITSNNLLGYNATGGAAYSGQTNSSQSWDLVDMNGDGKPDLVVTAALGANGATQFNATTSPNWQVYLNNGSGFSSTATTWSTPQGGTITSNNLLGYNSTYGQATAQQTNGSQSWSLVDMDGDGKPDLVVTAALAANGATENNATTSPNWQVYLNTGSGFSGTATTWSTPQGGTITSNNLLGYNATGGAAYTGQTTGSQSWDLIDINGDGKPDLVVTAALGVNGATEFDATTSPNWQVYLNTGSGFSATATTWSTPQGGNITSNNLLGYNGTAGQASAQQTNGSQTWALTDMNGDGKPDLVITAAQAANGPTENNATTSPNWQVYLNTGSGFSGTATTWSTPQGGTITSNNLLGYNGTGGAASTGQTTGSQSWDLVDINGDQKPDLVITAALAANGATENNATTSPTWQVYFNTGTGFSANATTWSTPQGGTITSNNLLGYNSTAGQATAQQTNGSQTWALTDMNGDGKPDLVVTAALAANGATEFDATTSPNWQVYLNGNTTGIPEISNISPQCILYPNPNNGSFTLQFTDAAERSVEVYDMMGRLITPPVTMQNQQQFNIGAVNAGIYLLRIMQNNEVSNVRFVVE